MDTFAELKAFFVRYRALLILIPLVLSIFIRLQPGMLDVTQDWAENSVHANVLANLERQVAQEFPTLPADQRRAAAQRQLDQVLADNADEIDRSIQETAASFKSRLQDDSGQTYLLAIDPYYWGTYTRNYVETGMRGTTINEEGQEIDEKAIAPVGRNVPENFHIQFTALVYAISTWFGNTSLMTALFYVPVIISALAIVPAYFLLRKTSGEIAALIGSIILAAHTAFVTRTVAGFADTDPYNVMFPLFIAWALIAAMLVTKKWRYPLAIVGGLLVGLYSQFWDGWWYIFDVTLVALAAYVAYEMAKPHLQKLPFKPEYVGSALGVVLFALLIYIAGSSATTLVAGALLGAIAGYMAYKLAPSWHEHWKNEAAAWKAPLLTGAAYVVTSIVALGLFSPKGFFNGMWGGLSAVFEAPLSVLALKEVASRTIWPNVFTTVAELNASSFVQTVGAMGGILLVGLALAGLLLAFMKKERVFAAFLVLVWFAVALYATGSGIRFTLVLVPPFAIGIGFFFNELYTFAKTYLHNSEVTTHYTWLILAAVVAILAYFAIGVIGLIGLVGIAVLLAVPAIMYQQGYEVNKRNVTSGAVVLALGILLVMPVVSAGYYNAYNQVPSMNDAWYDALTNIKENSDDNTIITSWWDFGHWFRYVADRAATFDGASQNRPQAHWTGRMLQTNDEQESIALLRMMDCGASLSYTTLLEQAGNETAAVKHLEQVLDKDEQAAREYITEQFNAEFAEELLQYTHCEPPQAFVIASEDMVGKAAVWGHFGTWDFNRASMVKHARNQPRAPAVNFLKTEFNLSEQEAQDRYDEVQKVDPNQWISSWPGYFGRHGCQQVSEDTHQCVVSLNNQQIPIVYNTTTHTTTIPQGQQVQEISYLEGDEFITKSLNGTMPLGLTFIPEGTSYVVLAADPLLSDSVFTRMFYMRGAGLDCFELFDEKTQLTGQKIYVYSVNWECA